MKRRRDDGDNKIERRWYCALLVLPICRWFLLFLLLSILGVLQIEGYCFATTKSLLLRSHRRRVPCCCWSGTTPSRGLPTTTARQSCLQRTCKSCKLVASLTGSLSDNVGIPQSDDDDDDQIVDASRTEFGRIWNAALLVAGTTIGGGFLALPTVVRPTGIVPAVAALSGTWLFFLVQSYVVIDCLQWTKRKREPSTTTTTAIAENRRSSPGISAAAQSAFGDRRKTAIALLLVVLTEATLVSQIARAGILFSGPPASSSSWMSLSYPLACALSSLSAAYLVFGTRRGLKFASESNSILTTLFLVSAVAVAAKGVPSAKWTRIGIGRPIGGASWKALPESVPVFLQLLVYGEILPTVCELLDYRTRPIRQAVAIGSMLTLVLQIGWAALGLCLIPTGGSSRSLDPVTVLLSTKNSPVRLPLLCLSVTAILTTILGSYLALESAYKDFDVTVNLHSRDEAAAENDLAGEYKTTLSGTTANRFKVASLIVLPALAIASTSPSIFLKAVDFAGSYPVLLLWGVAPPAIRLAQRKQQERQKALQSGTAMGRWRTGWLYFLMLLSTGLVGMSAKDDMKWLFQKLSQLCLKG